MFQSYYIREVMKGYDACIIFKTTEQEPYISNEHLTLNLVNQLNTRSCVIQNSSTPKGYDCSVIQRILPVLINE